MSNSEIKATGGVMAVIGTLGAVFSFVFRDYLAAGVLTILAIGGLVAFVFG